jgi:ketosteroid isomerase-like protein
MNKFIATLAATTILTMGFAGYASADSASQLAAIQAAYDNQCGLLQAGDFDGYANTLTSDFQVTDPQGNHSTRDRYVAQQKAAYQASGITITACTFVTSNFVANDDGSASVQAVWNMSASTGSRNVAVVTVCDDVWVSQNDTWLLERSTYVSATYK